eukprot:TRINITY_DN15595_c0_g1_i4.p1 TRINITY_DN15595_c0_g1~~TRINITY_DN15595_c0_g1_i4.p1  ORF type:complete len:1560 (+),score=426.06 TRINITY_DN15595_c0_g1_i4:126-4805(+)
MALATAPASADVQAMDVVESEGAKEPGVQAPGLSLAEANEGRLWSFESWREVVREPSGKLEKLLTEEWKLNKSSQRCSICKDSKDKGKEVWQAHLLSKVHHKNAAWYAGEKLKDFASRGYNAEPLLQTISLQSGKYVFNHFTGFFATYEEHLATMKKVVVTGYEMGLPTPVAMGGAGDDKDAARDAAEEAAATQAAQEAPMPKTLKEALKSRDAWRRWMAPRAAQLSAITSVDWEATKKWDHDCPICKCNLGDPSNHLPSRRHYEAIWRLKTELKNSTANSIDGSGDRWRLSLDLIVGDFDFHLQTGFLEVRQLKWSKEQYEKLLAGAHVPEQPATAKPANGKATSEVVKKEEVEVVIFEIVFNGSSKNGSKPSFWNGQESFITDEGSSIKEHTYRLHGLEKKCVFGWLELEAEAELEASAEPLPTPNAKMVLPRKSPVVPKKSQRSQRLWKWRLPACCPPGNYMVTLLLSGAEQEEFVIFVNTVPFKKLKGRYTDQQTKEVEISWEHGLELAGAEWREDSDKVVFLRVVGKDIVMVPPASAALPQDGTLVDVLLKDGGLDSCSLHEQAETGRPVTPIDEPTLPNPASIADAKPKEVAFLTKAERQSLQVTIDQLPDVHYDHVVEWLESRKPLQHGDEEMTLNLDEMTPQEQRDLARVVEQFVEDGDDTGDVAAKAIYKHVCVMGLHKSGTHALAEYVRRFFDVEVQPSNKRLWAGTVSVGDCSVWKHTVPLEQLQLPASAEDGGRVLLLLTIREPSSWLQSLSRDPYEIFPAPGAERPRKRKRLTIDWMLKPVQIRSAESYNDPYTHRCFQSMLDLWASYARGYLVGNLTPGGDKTHVCIVRHEDVVHRPAEVIKALEERGLVRNETAFEPIEDSVTVKGMKREEIIQRENFYATGGDPDAEKADAEEEDREGSTVGSTGEDYPQQARKAVAATLTPHKAAMDRLGYPVVAVPDEEEDDLVTLPAPTARAAQDQEDGGRSPADNAAGKALAEGSASSPRAAQEDTSAVEVKQQLAEQQSSAMEDSDLDVILRSELDPMNAFLAAVGEAEPAAKEVAESLRQEAPKQETSKKKEISLVATSLQEASEKGAATQETLKRQETSTEDFSKAGPVKQEALQQATLERSAATSLLMGELREKFEMTGDWKQAFRELERTGAKSSSKVISLEPPGKVAEYQHAPRFDDKAAGLPRDWNRGEGENPKLEQEVLWWGKRARKVFKETSSSPDINSFLSFLGQRRSRDDYHQRVLNYLGPPLPQRDGWYSLEWRRPADVRYDHSTALEKKFCSGWVRAWHGCKLEALYSILVSGYLWASGDEERGDRFFTECRGVYVHKDGTKHKAESYIRFVPLCDDGIFWAVKWEVLVDRSQNVKPPHQTDQWIQKENGVKLKALWVCGRNSQQMKEGDGVAMRWDPLLEAHPYKWEESQLGASTDIEMQECGAPPSKEGAKTQTSGGMREAVGALLTAGKAVVKTTLAIRRPNRKRAVHLPGRSGPFASGPSLVRLRRKWRAVKRAKQLNLQATCSHADDAAGAAAGSSAVLPAPPPVPAPSPPRERSRSRDRD